MAGDNGVRLVATLEARVNRFEKELAKANGSARREFGAIEQRAGQMSRRLETTVSGAATRAQGALKGLAGAFAGGFLGGFAAGGVQGFVSEIRAATRSMSELKAEASRAGVSTTAFQELGYAAKQNGVSIDALTDGLKELQLRADEFVVTGAGSGAEAFQRLGYTADELKAKLRDPSRLFTEIIGRIAALRDTAAGIRIADEIFGGTGGEQFVRFLDEGEAGIRRNIDEAHRLGQVLDEDVIRKGAELDKQFQKIADTIGTNIKSAVVSVATALASWSTNVEGFLNSLGNSSFFKFLADNTAMDWATTGGVQRIPQTKTPEGGPDPKAVDVLRRAMVAAGGVARDAVPDRTRQLPATFVDPKLGGLQTSFRDNLAQLITAAKEAGHTLTIQSGKRTTERQQKLWSDAVAKYGSEAEARKWVAPPGRSFHEKGTAADLNYAGTGMKGDTAAAKAAREWAHANAQRFGVEFPLGNEPWHAEPAGQRGKPREGEPDTSGLEAAASEKAAAARKKVADAAAQQEEKVRRVMEALGLEAAQIGKTAEQQEVLQRLQAAGVDLSSKEGQAIAAKVAELYRLQAAQQAVEQSAAAMKQAREEMASTGADATKSILADMKNGVSAADAFTNALDRIATKLLDMVVDNAFAALFQTGQGEAPAAGGNWVSSIVSSLFGAPRAKGGRLEPGKTHLVGEEGPELVRGSGTVIPHAASMAMLSAPPQLPAAAAFAQPSVSVTSAPVNVTVNNSSGAKVTTKEERSSNGERSVTLLIEEKIGNALSRRSAASKSAEDSYGLQRRVPRR